LISLSTGICDDREFKEKIARLIVHKIFYSNQMRLLLQDKKDLQLKNIAQSNIIKVHEMKEDIYKSQIKSIRINAVIYTVLAVALIYAGIRIGVSLN